MNYIKVQRNTSIKELLVLISGQKTRCVFVLEKKKLIGVLSVGDILRFFNRNTITSTYKVEELMNYNFHYVKQPYDTQNVKDIFKKHTISALPVLNHKDEITEVLTPYDFI